MLEQPYQMGWELLNGDHFLPDLTGRQSLKQTLLEGFVWDALRRINAVLGTAGEHAARMAAWTRPGGE